MKKIETYQDALTALGLDPNKLPDVSTFPENDQKQVLAHYKLIKIAEALNGGWKPDWNNGNEYKYYPWFYNAAGFGFSFSDWTYTSSYTFVGSRLCFKTSTLAEYAGKQFEAIYKEYFGN